MNIKRVKLENIRSYTSQEIEFPEGSVLLSGDIGAGKSTILYAIEFALFGSRRTELSGESLLRKGENSGSVELEFELNNKKITIKRMLKKVKNSIKQDAGYIVIGGVREDATPVELKSKVLELLGYPQELLTKSKGLIYRYTVYTPQEEMKKILEEDKELRLDTLRKLFGMDKYKKIRENCIIYLKKLKEEKNYLSGEIEDLPLKVKLKEDKTGEKKTFTVLLEELTPRIIEINTRLESKKQEFEKIQTKIKEFNEIKKQSELNELNLKNKAENLEKNNDEVKKLEIEIKILEEKRPAIDLEEKNRIIEEIEILEKKHIEIIKKISEGRERKKFLEQRLEDTRNIIKEYCEKIKDEQEINKKIIEIEGKVKNEQEIKQENEENQKKLNEINKKINESEINKKNSLEIKSKILDLNQCPTCLQDVDIEYKDKVKANEDEK